MKPITLTSDQLDHALGVSTMTNDLESIGRNTTMTTIDATLSALGLSVIWTTGSEGETVSSVAIPRDDARRAVAALLSIGAEASEAPDNDDRNVSWLYVEVIQ